MLLADIKEDTVILKIDIEGYECKVETERERDRVRDR